MGKLSLSLISLIVLCAQNSLLTILLRYSRTHTSHGHSYSSSSAVLAVELLKCLLSLVFAWRGAPDLIASDATALNKSHRGDKHQQQADNADPPSVPSYLLREVFSPDCWKLSIPATLYVIQNNLQFVAATNLDVPTFQVTYNLKILSTALFSVILLGRRLYAPQWMALGLLAGGVAIVQLQNPTSDVGKQVVVEGDRLTGLMAVMVACMTSGLAGVYFELVLKGSKVDLWIRNVQLSCFSLLPALSPIFFPNFSSSRGYSLWPSFPSEPLFANFNRSAWAVVLVQVLGGLVTAVVVKYSDNIMKGFATSIAIVLSFVAGVILFDFRVTPSFLLGSTLVVFATYLYNKPSLSSIVVPPSPLLMTGEKARTPLGRHGSRNSRSETTPHLPLSRSNSTHLMGLAIGGIEKEETVMFSPTTFEFRTRQSNLSGPATPDFTVPDGGRMDTLHVRSASRSEADRSLGHVVE